MLRASNRPLLAYFDSIKNLRLRQLNLILKTGYDSNLLVNARGQNGLQYMINYFGATEAHYRLQVPLNKASYLSIAKLLIDSGLDPNAIDLLSGETAIYDAIRYNDKDMVALLINYADFSIKNKNGETALMCAARFGSKVVMKMILEHLRLHEMDGYFLRQRNRYGLTALELARAENLECAKVLTKHLITFGHHTGAVLARSNSHHQLRAALPYHLRAAGPSYSPGRVMAAAPANLLDDSASDYDSDVLAYHPAVPPTATRGSISRALTTGFKTGSGLYDPKAAEFNQYLLEQQELMASPPVENAGVTATMSDDEDYFAAPTGSSTGLTRSRSCMLGPNSSGAGGSGNQAKQAKYNLSEGSSKVKDQRKLSSWEGQNSAGRTAMG